MKLLEGSGWVVDTNVIVAANGGACHVDRDCEEKCTNFLIAVMERGVVFVDARDQIIGEYWKKVSPGVKRIGDIFFKHVNDHLWGNGRVKQRQLQVRGEGEFNGLPANNLDPNDRKFLAVAVSANATIANATDSDWSEQKELLDELGVQLCQVCPCYATKGNGGSY